MEFHKFHEKFQKNFTELIANATHLYEVEVDKDELWNLYLDSFPAGTNNIYRTRREYDCSCCSCNRKNREGAENHQESQYSGK